MDATPLVIFRPGRVRDCLCDLAQNFKLGDLYTMLSMFTFIVLAAATHSTTGHATPKAMAIMAGIMLLIWIVGKLFSRNND